MKVTCPRCSGDDCLGQCGPRPCPYGDDCSTCEVECPVCHGRRVVEEEDGTLVFLKPSAVGFTEAQPEIFRRAAQLGRTVSTPNTMLASAVEKGFLTEEEAEPLALDWVDKAGPLGGLDRTRMVVLTPKPSPGSPFDRLYMSLNPKPLALRPFDATIVVGPTDASKLASKPLKWLDPTVDALPDDTPSLAQKREPSFPPAKVISFSDAMRETLGRIAGALGMPLELLARPLPGPSRPPNLTVKLAAIQYFQRRP